MAEDTIKILVNASDATPTTEKNPSVIDLKLLPRVSGVMADFRDDGKIVTNFLLSTCRLRQGLNYDTLMNLRSSAVVANIRLLSDDDEAAVNAWVNPVITGSAAEFYIEPAWSCIGDTDIMYHLNTCLAIPAGTAPPTQLPDEFDSSVVVFEIVDSEFPGYVYLVSSYLLTECIDDDHYNVLERQRRYMII